MGEAPTPRHCRIARPDPFFFARNWFLTPFSLLGTTWQSTVAFSGAKQCLVRDKDDHGGARWSCIFRFADRSEADKAVVDIVKRLRNNLPQGWIGTDLDEDSDTESYTKTDKFSAHKPGNNSAIRVYFIDTKKDGRVKIYLSVENN